MDNELRFYNLGRDDKKNTDIFYINQIFDMYKNGKIGNSIDDLKDFLLDQISKH